MSKKTLSPSNRVRLADVAREANMSIATVSMSLTNHPNVNAITRQRVHDICSRLGYHRKGKARDEAPPSRMLQFGYVLVGNRLDDEAKMILIHALTLNAARLGMRFEMTGVEKEFDSPAAVEQIMTFAGHLNGLILTGQVEETLMRRLGASGIPFVLIGHLSDEKERALPANGELIAYDSTAMGRAATEYLLARGHRRIGFASEVMPAGMVHDRWLAGYQVALLRTGIVPQPEWVHVAGARLAGGKPAADAMAQLADPPTAYVIPDVRIAASFATALRNHGHSIDAGNLVISGEREVATRYRMENYPMLTLDMDHLAALSLDRLKHLCQHAREVRYSINLPFISFNMNG